GIPTPEVLRMATVVSARVMGDDGDYGSIAPGKVADIVIVDGNPAQRIGDLRNVQQVMLAGRLYESETLLRALRTAQESRRSAGRWNDAGRHEPPRVPWTPTSGSRVRPPGRAKGPAPMPGWSSTRTP